MKKRAMKKWIPKGIYCYDDNGCKWWRGNTTKDYQLSGYCIYLKTGDWYKEGTMLLWDECKECGIKQTFDFDKPKRMRKWKNKKETEL